MDPQGNFFDYDKSKEERWQPRYFKQIAHPNVYNEIIDTREDEPIHFELITGPEGYWEKRNSKDWNGSLNLWGPFP